MDIGRISSQNIGNSGEYYLASVLSAKNFVVTVTLGRNEVYDLLAVNPKGNAVKISVKAKNQKKENSFILGRGDENRSDDDLFYALVRLNEFKEEPDFWILPSKVVAKLLKSSHAKWLETPGRNGRRHSDSNRMRMFWVTNGPFYPKEWAEEIKKYHKNIKILEDL